MKLRAHPDEAAIAWHLRVIGRRKDVRFEGDLFRFINPKYSKPSDVLSGSGAQYASGRWNVAGIFNLSYTALAPETALAEALAHARYFGLPITKALPKVLVSVRLRATRVLDLRDGSVRKTLRLSENTMRNLDWRAENQQGRQALTQAWGLQFSKAGFEAVLVPSAADSHGSNALVFPKNLLKSSTFRLTNRIQWPDK